ncbi:phospholipid-binding protein MlaC [Verrucomicrobiota bacterium]
MSKTLFVLMILAIFVRPAAADDKSDAATIVSNTVEAVLECLGNKDLSDERKRDVVVEIITPAFDFPLMGKLALGKRQWPKFDAEQRKEYTDLFVRQLQDSYADKISLFADEKVEYEEPVAVKTKIHAPTTVVSKDERTPMLYKLYRAPQGWKIYDVEIKGVSIVSSYRAQYAQVLKTGSVEDLLRKMKEKVTAKGDDEGR